MALKKKGKKGKTISIDFEGVESGSGQISKEGQYLVEIQEVEEKTSESSGEPYLAWRFQVASKKQKGRVVYHNTSLQPQALFNLRGLLEAMGTEVPDGEMDLNLSDFVGEQVGVEIEMEEYNGKDKPRIVGFLTTDSIEEGSSDDEDEEEEDNSDDDSEDEDEEESDDEDDDEEESDDEDEDEDEDEDDEDSDDEDEDEDEDDEDEEDEKPSKSKSKAKAKSKAKPVKAKPSKKRRK